MDPKLKLSDAIGEENMAGLYDAAQLAQSKKQVGSKGCPQVTLKNLQILRIQTSFIYR